MMQSGPPALAQRGQRQRSAGVVGKCAKIGGVFECIRAVHRESSPGETPSHAAS
jgi:hypothetical protein